MAGLAGQKFSSPRSSPFRVGINTKWREEKPCCPTAVMA